MEFEFEGHLMHVIERGAASAEVVVLHHGLFATATGYDRVGLIDALSERLRVWAPDSFGHGSSADASSDELNGRDARADLLVALADRRGVDRFHYVGYSMGGWIGGALARRHPDRLRSLSLGGWDPEAGLDTAKRTTREVFGIDLDMNLARSLAASAWPEVEEATPERVKGWSDTWAKMGVPPHDTEHLARMEVPLHMWCGEGDAYYEPMHRISTELGARFDRLEGDHMSAYATREAAAAISEFLAEATAPLTTNTDGDRSSA